MFGYSILQRVETFEIIKIYSQAVLMFYTLYYSDGKRLIDKFKAKRQSSLDFDRITSYDYYF